MTIAVTTILAATALAAAPGDDVLRAGASLAPGSLDAGETREIVVTVEIADGWSAAAAGIPKPFLQLDVPPSVELIGPRPRTAKELARNEFLLGPLERLVDPGTTRVPFTLAAAPAPDATIGLNVVAYLRHDDGAHRFVRRRLELPLEAGAAARAGPATVSDWGESDDDPATGLQIGDRAPTFALPRADGTTLDLDAHLGRRSIVITTYRAFW